MGNKSSTLTITEPGANTVDDANNNNNNNLPVTDEKKLAKGGDISEDTKSHDTKEKSKKCKKESKKKSKKESKDKVDEPKVKAKKASKTDKSPSETIELRVGQMLEVVDRIEDSVAHQLQANNASQQNTLMRRTLIHKPAWRESLTSLRSTDLNIYKLGESRSGLKGSYAGPAQDFEEIKRRCLNTGIKFEDPAFPATDASFYLHGSGSRRFKWLRPHEIVDQPKFFSGGAHRFDVMQGELGNCWLLAAVANLTLNNKFFQRVVPHDQSFEEDYAGIFHFRFWQYGKWIDVVIDDRLPTINGQLMLMHSSDQNEFWSALLEKAYAKLHGSYESLKGGTTSEAMEDFTGGLTEHYELQSPECPQDLFKVMLKAHQRGSFMGCSITAADSSQMEARLPNGLIKGHAYSITSIKFVQIDHFKVQGKIPLIRVRNPWGNEAEWNGPWSDKSREWTVVNDTEKKILGLTFDSDGEFWMSLNDWKEQFTSVEITNLTPDSLDDDLKRRWEVNYFEGQWIPGESAGGCRNQLSTFYMNPQYMITLVDPDEDDDDDLCTCVVALMQKNHRIKRKMGLDNLTIGFAIYEVKDSLTTVGHGQSQVLNTNFFRYNASVARSATFINLREVNGRFRLKPGRYCIIPSTFEANQKGEFLIRFFTEKPAKNVVENDEEIGTVDEGGKGFEDDNKENGDLPNGPVIDEQIRGDWKPDPDPIPGEDGTPGANSGPSLVDMLTACISLLSLARQCYESVNQKPDVVAELANKTEQAEGGGEAEKAAKTFFQKIAGDDMEVDAFELQQVLNHAFKKELKDEFTLESARSMVAMMDVDQSGKLGFNEFILLWRQLRNWREIFKRHDQDGSNTITTGELREAFREVGILVNRQIMRILINRYSHHSKKTGQVEDSLYFSDFCLCSIKVLRCIQVWKSKKQKEISGLPTPFSIFTQNLRSLGGLSEAQNTSPFTIDEFIQQVIYS